MPAFDTYVDNQLVMMKRSDGTVDMFIANMIPDWSFLLSPTRNLKFLRSDNNFTGYAVISNLDGTLRHIWRYENGTSIRTVNLVPLPPEEAEKWQGTRIRTMGQSPKSAYTRSMDSEKGNGFGNDRDPGKNGNWFGFGYGGNSGEYIQSQNTINNLLSQFENTENDQNYNLVDLINDQWNNTNEQGMVLSQDKYGNWNTSPIIEGTFNNVSLPLVPGIKATAHSHLQSTPPNIGDVIGTAQASNYGLEASFIYGADGSAYALVVEDERKAQEFYNQYGGQREEMIDEFVDRAEKHAQADNNPTPSSIQQQALQDMLNIYDTGISVYKLEE